MKMSNISELLDNFAIDNIRLMQGSYDMDSIEKDRAEILQAFAEKDKRIAELEKKYEAYKISNYDPSESIRLNGEIMHQKNRIAELESENLSLRHDKAIIDNYVKELEAQVEKMKKAIDIRDRIME